MTTVLITGPTRGLGRATTLALAHNPKLHHLLLVGREGPALRGVGEEARRYGVDVHEIGCDLSRLADVRAAAGVVRSLVDEGRVGPVDALVANAGAMTTDTRLASADGYEMTFAVNYLAHAQLIGDLVDALADHARILLIGSNTYHANVWRRLLHVPAADWRDPVELARPAGGEDNPGTEAAGVAYSDAKLAILYYAHELQRRIGEKAGVAVFEPGWMPGTALGRDAPEPVQRIGRGLARLPGVATPERSGPVLASMALDDRWADVRDGAFVVRGKVTEVKPFAHDRDREARLWDATAQLLEAARR
ncbi:SDR family NAD(P)-dependent oxidoreductase [Luteipulveratus flavus]|uniref:SDR family NAD(P)-dependent oxidoreductase n=1 Tax=Luteipulveratus flavus TaxID=3031728 RepID=A0ABT6C241_9MICO|nr:SDR family NAD(P)-dependent oxidoreductase [Luteipulveratus sp. YIM 133296]MDF8262671.1 SDR family NAD(P)-dependent oxidoreductase [Luteipulveratus sp. YIM 133296]